MNALAASTNLLLSGARGGWVRFRSTMSNADEATIRGFGEEWRHFDQRQLPSEQRRRQYEQYFAVFPWDQIGADAVGFDMGCGSGRWAQEVCPRVGRLHCIDGSAAALDVARRNLATATNCEFHQATFGALPLPDRSMDFGYSLGVLHHVPDTLAALAECVRKLKNRGPFLVYVYYDLEDRPLWFRLIWRVSDTVRRLISRLPFRPRLMVTSVIAAVIYLPLARAAALAESCGLDVRKIPLSTYRDKTFYWMRTDALDRFGTHLEKRYSRSELIQLMVSAGLTDIQVSDTEPYWCAVGHRADAAASA